MIVDVEKLAATARSSHLVRASVCQATHVQKDERHNTLTGCHTDTLNLPQHNYYMKPATVHLYVDVEPSDARWVY